MRSVLLVCLAILLVGCSSIPAGNVVVDKPPVRTCRLDGFSCIAGAAGPGAFAFTIRNNAAFDMLDVSLHANTGDCELVHDTIALGRLPANVATPVKFVCKAPPEQGVVGTLELTFHTKTGKSIEQRSGAFTFQSAK